MIILFFQRQHLQLDTFVFLAKIVTRYPCFLKNIQRMKICSLFFLLEKNEIMLLTRNNTKTAGTNMTKKRMLENKIVFNTRFFVMFVTAVCVLFLIKLRWPKKKKIMLLTYEKEEEE